MCGLSCAQADRTISIRMLDSKTGVPITTTSEFQVWIDHASGTNRTFVRPDKDGMGKIELSPNASVISVHAQYGKGDSVKDRGPYSDRSYSVSEILTTGIAAPNYCGKQKAVAKAGEFVFFVRPMTFWEKTRQ